MVHTMDGGERVIGASQLMLDAKGRVMHLAITPEVVGDTVILVGDPGRVRQVGEHLEGARVVGENREFITLLGSSRGENITVISTGIGVGCVDIVLNELDALVNIDLARRQTRGEHRALRLVRLGTCGALQPDVESGSILCTAISADCSSLGYYYEGVAGVENRACRQFLLEGLRWPEGLNAPVCVPSSPVLLQKLGPVAVRKGITLSMPGFFAPQGRELRLGSRLSGAIRQVQGLEWNGLRVENMEMESGGLNLLAALLGHHAITLCVAINNRDAERTTVDYRGAMDGLIERVLGLLAGQ